MREALREPFEYSLRGEEKVYVAGFFNSIVCIETKPGQIQPFKESENFASEITLTYDEQGNISHSDYVITYDYTPAKCPLLRKCADCPNR